MFFLCVFTMCQIMTLALRITIAENVRESYSP
jgi:hypothetical protein